MLARRWLLILSFAIMLTAGTLSIWVSHETYQFHIWPYILIYLGFTFTRHIFFVVGTFLDERRRMQASKELKKIPVQMWPTISILMPAFNEEKIIEKSILNIFNLKYPSFEVIIIDDGSTDKTYKIAETLINQFSNISAKIITKTNAGKSNALNFGLLHASGELIVCVDADSRIATTSLIEGARHFLDNKTGAVAGFVEVENQEGLLQRLQQYEYLTSLNFLRKSYSILGIVPIVPGPIGMYRRSAIDQVGGFITSRNMFAEDAEMSLRLIANGWKIRSEEGMLAYTESPDTLRGFFRQRYRWNRGTFQALELNFPKMIAGENKLSNFLALHLFSEIWLTPLLNVMLIFNFVTRMLLYQEIHLFTIWIAFVVFIDIWVAIMATYKTRRIFWALPNLLISKLFYENTLFLWRLFSLYDEFNNKYMTWDKLDRTGNLKEASYE